jgi:hypothetical protein
VPRRTGVRGWLGLVLVDVDDARVLAGPRRTAFSTATAAKRNGPGRTASYRPNLSRSGTKTCEPDSVSQARYGWTRREPGTPKGPFVVRRTAQPVAGRPGPPRSSPRRPRRAPPAPRSRLAHPWSDSAHRLTSRQRSCSWPTPAAG